MCNTKPKYKTGDKVLMGPEIWQKEKYPHSQPHAVDLVVKIMKVRDYIYDVENIEGQASWCVHESQILGHYFQYGEEIEIKETRDGPWLPGYTFCAYLPTPNGVRVAALYESLNKPDISYEARPLPSPQEEETFQLVDDLNSIPVLEALLKRHEKENDLLLTAGLRTALNCLIAEENEVSGE